MIPWLRGFLFNETAFVGLVRGAIQALGVTQAAGLLNDGFPPWVGIAAVFLGGFIRAGERNAPLNQSPPA